MQRSPIVIFGFVSRSLAVASLCVALVSCGSSEPTTPVAVSSGESSHAEHQHKDHQHNNADHDGSSMAMAPTGNAMCPLYPDEKVDPAFFVLYQGERIGMCCEECTWEWDVLTDDEKQGYVQAMQQGVDDDTAEESSDAG